jgi:dTDP-4-dehydrorhamnose reductase
MVGKDMKILVLGQNGMLGSDLLLRLSACCDVIGRDIGDFDITQAESCRELVSKVDPDVVINATGYTDVDGCETSVERCFAVNASGVRNLALACKPKDIKVVHFSTDYVFDGQKSTPYAEEDACFPVNVYGRSKLAGENELKGHSGHFLLIRTAWLYGKNGKNFVKTIIEKAKINDYFDVVDDQKGCPTYTWDLCGAVEWLIKGGHAGIFHVTNTGCCSWYEFALKILEYAGMTDISVRPIKSDQLTRPARRPSYSVLSNQKLFNTSGKTMRSWQDALAGYLRTIII